MRRGHQHAPPQPGGKRRHRRRTVTGSGRPNRLRYIRGAAVVACAAGLCLLALLTVELALRVLHFAFWPFAVLLALTAGAALYAILVGLWQAAFGPRRAGAIGWAALGLLPVLALATPLAYGAAQWSHRGTPRNLPMTLAKAFGASLMEGVAAVRYPRAIETPHLLMYCDEHVTRSRQDADAGEAYVTGLARYLGIRLRSRIHWIRGPLLGQGELQYFGLALGSDESPVDWQDDYLDRHELAHAVVAQQEPRGADPPTLLQEGWAESQAIGSSRDLARHALAAPDSGGSPTLARLTDREWYHRDEGAVYAVGGALVEYLLRVYGPRRFVRLYDTARPGAFDAACRQCLGVDVAALDRDFWRDARRTALAR